MWEIYEHRRVSRQFDSLPTDVLKIYEKWKDIVTISGLQGLSEINGLRCDSLRREWKGYRSSRFNQQYRVIYQVEKDKVFVQVVNVSPHDCRRK